MRSLSLYTAAVASMASFAAAAKDSRTFAVLHFHGDGPLTIGRSDPIVNPGVTSSHVHAVQGGNAFGNAATGESMLKSTCSTANIAGDKSAYWMPSVYFHDVQNGTFEPVPLFYMNVYYFFEATNDDIKAFPVGLQMVSGNATKKTPPPTGADVLDPSAGTIQPAQFTCPRKSFDPPSYPAGSDGSKAGIQDPNNKGSGAGFPFAECDGYASPLRADLHFPSCYDPSKALTDFRANMAFPTDAGGGKQDCPPGWVHVPHLFYEMYWNTPLFADRWTPNQGSQPFVLSNGDAAGYSLHGDFLAAWDTDVLQTIIDTCDAGDSGMDKCPNVATVLDGTCNIANPSPEKIDGVLTALPGNNPLFGWAYGTGAAVEPTAATTTVAVAAAAAAATTTDATTTAATTTDATTMTKATTETTPTTSSTKTSSTSTSTTTTDKTTTTTATRTPTSPPATTLIKSTRPAAISYGGSGSKPSSIPAVVGAQVSPSAFSSSLSFSSLSSSSSSPSSSSTSTSSTTSSSSASSTTPSLPLVHGCKPHAHATTVLTETITLYSTSTSTVFRATATKQAKHAHHQAHRRRL